MIKRILCLLLACLLLLPAGSFAKGENPSEIRVLLRRLYLADRADLTLSGRYLARSETGTELLLSDGAKVTVLLQDRQLILFSGGVSAAMGGKCSLLRQDSGEKTPGIRFNLQAGFYPGDLSLSIDEGKIRPVLTLPLETYLQGVVPYEMGDGFPEEALKAQAVCARTYALSHLDPKSAWDVVDTTNDQVFRGIPANSPKSSAAVTDTAGLVLTCDGKLITAWYSASNGGQTELPSNIWTGDVPRCFAMTEDPWDAENPEATVRTCTLNRNAADLSPAFVKLLRKAALSNDLLRDSVPDEKDFRIQRLVSLELITPRYAAPSRLMTQMKVTFELVPRREDPSAAESTEEEDDLDITELLSAVPVTVTDSNLASPLLQSSESAFFFPKDLDEESAKDFKPEPETLNGAAIGTMGEGSDDAENSTLTVIGSYDAVTANYIGSSSYNNAAYFVNLFNTLSQRDDMSIVIEGKDPSANSLGLTSVSEIAFPAIIVRFVIPIAVVLIGLIIWIRRRHR